MSPEIYKPREARSTEWLQGYLNSIKEYKETDKAAIFVVGINGARINGTTHSALNRVLERIESHGCKTLIAHLKEIQMTDSDDAYSQDPNSAKYPVPFDDDIPDIHELLLLADGIVFATSTNWGKQTPRMSLFENHLTPLENSGFLLEGKTSGHIVTGEESGQIGVLENQLWVMSNMGMTPPPYGAIYIISSRPGKDKKGTTQIRPRWAREDLDLLADNLLKRVLSDRFSGVNWDRRRSGEQIKRLQTLLRSVDFEGVQLIIRLPNNT